MEKTDKIFYLLTKASDRTMLFHEVASKNCEIMVKGKKDLSFRVRVKVFRNELDLLCESADGIQPTLFEGEEVMAQIDLNGEKFFLKTKARWHDELLILPTNVDIYQLQRRQTWRIKIPRSYKAKAIIEKLGDESVNYEGMVLDFSVGGVRLQVPGALATVPRDTAIQIMLTFGNRSPILITGYIRHKVKDASNEKLQLFGIEFKPVSQLMESRLFALSMDLHRELFMRQRA